MNIKLAVIICGLLLALGTSDRLAAQSAANSLPESGWEDVGGVKVRRNAAAHAQLSGYAFAKYESYNSGGGAGGSSSEKRLTFCPNGSMKLYSQSVVTMNVGGGGGNSASEEKDEGYWDVYEDQSGNLFLKVRLQKNGEGFLNFTLKDGKMTLGNGQTLSRTTADCR